MLCPFCKSIGNTILPHTPPHIAQSRLPLSALSSDAQSSREARVDVGSSNYLSCLLNSFTEQETDFQTDFTRYVKSLLPAAPASTPLVSDGTMEPTEISSSVAKGELSSSSPAYDSVIADGQFQEDIVSNFIPLWSAESSSLTTRFQTLLKTDLCRTTHLTWSAAAYTILSASRAKSWLSRENSGTEARLTHGLLDPVQDEREISFMYQLLLILRSIAPKLYNSNHSELEDGIIAPLGDLLAGCKTSSTASIFAKMDGERKESSCIITELPTYDQACSAVRSQPLLSVGTIAFPDLKRQSILIGHASRVNVNYDSTQRTMKKLGAKEKWPFLLTPLLEQDLHTIAIAFVSTATDITRTMDALSLICLARLAQILIEPAATGVAAVNSKVATALLKPEVSRHREHMKDSDSVYIDGGFAPSKVAIIDNVACHSSTSVAIANADSLVGQTPARKFRDSDATDTIFGISSRKREREREEGRYYEDQKDTSAPALLPDSIKNSSTGNEDITTADLGEKLEKLRGLIHLNCGIFSSVPHAPDASTQTYEWESRDSILKGLDLLRTVLDSWLPFLEFCCSLRVVLHSGSAATNIQADNLERMGMEVDDSGTEAQSLNGDIRHLCILLSTLGLLNQPLITPTYPTASSHEDMPSQLCALLSSHGLVSMCILWAEQMAADTATTAAASAPISWIPRPKASVKGSVTRTAEKVVSEHLRQNIDEIAAGVQQCGDTFTVPLQTQENIEIGNDGPSDEISHHYYNSEDEDEDDDDDDGSDDSDDLVDNVDDIENIDDQDHDDDDYEDDEESADSDDEGDGGMGFFEQQIAGFLANQPNGDDGTGRAPDMGGLMAAVMQHMGMEPNTEMPANVAAIFRSFQVPVDTGNAAQGGRSLWRMVGLDPTNIHVDAHLSNLYDYDSPSVHTRAPLRGSITGRTLVYGIQGAPLREGFNDLSHFGVGNRHRGGLISLPLVYTDLHQMTTFPEALPGHSVDEPALCLLCGQILHAGVRAVRGAGSDTTPSTVGECTLHARGCGAGVGVFFLVQKCSVLLMRGPRTCIYPSIYLDQNGDVPDVNGHIPPLFLSLKNLRRLEEMYLGHHIAREVTRRRSSQNKVTRLNYY